jgi:lysophospholipid acyltransferase (LPLAT)-like uncharacterized protein
VPKPATAAKITFLQQLASFLAAALLKTLAWTLRVRWKDEAGFYAAGRRNPLILCIWHNRLLGGIFGDYRARQRRAVPISVLTSASKDGGWLAAVARRFRIGAVRGSSSRRGGIALLEITRHLGEGRDIAITPDGPRGPNYKLAPGIFYLAQRTSVKIVPVDIQLSSFWRLGRKWDALWIPKPFSRIDITYCPALEISPDESALDQEIARLDQAMGAK